MKLESAEAYITQLEDECQEYSHSQNAVSLEGLKKKMHEVEKENDDLRMKIEYQDAYIEHLEADNIKASVVSRRSGGMSKLGDHKKLLKADRDHSMVSMEQSSRFEMSIDDKAHLINKIKLINEFIESYRKDAMSTEKEEEFRQQLNNHYLDELLNTIFYRLER
jgi:hypothetical protein